MIAAIINLCCGVSAAVVSNKNLAVLGWALAVIVVPSLPAAMAAIFARRQMSGRVKPQRARRTRSPILCADCGLCG